MLPQIVSLIVGTAASVVAGVLLLRFWMQVVRVRPPASLSQFIFQMTDWLVRPLRRVFPGVGGYDWASLIGAFLIAVVATAIELIFAGPLSGQTILAWSLLRLTEWIFYGLTGLILIGALFSWVNPHAPLAPFVDALNEPLLAPLRRVVPLIGNLDLSPLVALVLLRIGMHVTTYLISMLA